MENKSVYVFDLDGTLVDSMPWFTRGTLSILEEAGIPYGPDMIEIVTPLGYTKTAEYYVSLGVPGTVESVVRQMEDKLYREYSQNVFTKPGVKEYLASLRESGARLFVLTASPHLVTDVCLKRNGVFDWFEKVWSVEDFGMSKSDVNIFYEVARTIGCEPVEVRYFDDNLTALTNAALAGYETYGVYDGQEGELLRNIRQVSHHFVESFQAL